MYVDDCRHSFEELASTVLPQLMEQLKVALVSPHPTSLFAQSGKGVAWITQQLKRDRDFSGCYVMLNNDQPFYVGISRSVIARLKQHLCGKTHFDASLVYSMAQRRLPTKGKRSDVMAIPAFREEFIAAQTELRNRSVAFIEIENPVELYVFEAYAALSLGTWEWNTFRTH